VEELNMTEYKYYTGTSIKATTGLVAAYSPSKDTVQGGQLLDISGNGNHGTINGGAILTKDGMKFDGVDDKVTIGDIENVKTIALRVKLNSTSEKILEGQANDILVYSNAGTLSYSDFDNAYVNGVDSDTVVSGQWINVVITSSTDVDCSALTLALNNTTYGNLEISDVRFYSDEKDSDWAKAYHNSFTKPYLVEDFSNHPVGDTSPKGFVQGTGAFVIQEDIIRKFLECTTNGTISINLDLDEFISNGYIEIDRFSSSAWTTHKSTVDALKAQAWFDYSDKKITLTAVAGERFANIKIFNGVKL
jgi:hypothetical protein